VRVCCSTPDGPKSQTEVGGRREQREEEGVPDRPLRAMRYHRVLALMVTLTLTGRLPHRYPLIEYLRFDSGERLL
jgi:hypothetical protein